MDARKRQRLLRIADLAGKHPLYANALGVRVGIHSKGEEAQGEQNATYTRVKFTK